MLTGAAGFSLFPPDFFANLTSVLAGAGAGAGAGSGAVTSREAMASAGDIQPIARPTSVTSLGRTYGLSGGFDASYYTGQRIGQSPIIPTGSIGRQASTAYARGGPIFPFSSGSSRTPTVTPPSTTTSRTGTSTGRYPSFNPLAAYSRYTPTRFNVGVLAGAGASYGRSSRSYSGPYSRDPIPTNTQPRAPSTPKIFRVDTRSIVQRPTVIPPGPVGDRAINANQPRPSTSRNQFNARLLFR